VPFAKQATRCTVGPGRREQLTAAMVTSRGCKYKKAL
jgi:hypothetical protein